MTIQRYRVEPTGAPRGAGVEWVKEAQGNLILHRDMVQYLRKLRAQTREQEPGNPELHSYAYAVHDTINAILKELGETP
jgi:hypothetical protein